MRIIPISFSFVMALGASACVVKTTDATNPEPATPATAGPSTPSAAAAPASPATAQPAYSPPAKPTTAPAEHALAAAVGTPSSMHAGAPETIWVWHDGDGMSWHVRTTTASAKDVHRFSGRIWTTGKLETVTPYSLETKDRIRQEDPGAMGFDFVTGGSIDGFDFRANARSCVIFHLLVDQKAAAPKITIGAKEEHPAAATFRICG